MNDSTTTSAPHYSRRRVLAAGAAGALAAAVPGLARSARAASSSPTPLKTIVIACQENRTLDHYFGYAPFIGSHGVPAGWTNPTGQGGTIAPYHLQSQFAGTPNDPAHEWAAIHAEVDNGTMDGFYTTDGAVSMGYYDGADIPYYYALAKHFTLCPNFFCSLLGPTNPNRVSLVAGTAGGNTTNNIPHGSLTFPCLFDLLDAYGISWKIYNGFLGIAAGFNPASYFARWQNDPRANVDDDVYFTDCQNGTLPQVAFIVPHILFCEHPPAPPYWGSWYTAKRISALTRSPQWAHAAFLLTYDEGGGFFDHVAPPTIDAYGCGLRIPTMVVSPYASGGSSNAAEVFDHSSILKMIETVFSLPTLASLNHQFDQSTPGQNNDAAGGKPTGPAAPPRDGSAALGNLIDVFNFGMAPRAAPPLPPVPTPRGVPTDPAVAQRFADQVTR